VSLFEKTIFYSANPLSTLLTMPCEAFPEITTTQPLLTSESLYQLSYGGVLDYLFGKTYNIKILAFSQDRSDTLFLPAMLEITDSDGHIVIYLVAVS
jgi:hypothetical protein